MQWITIGIIGAEGVFDWNMGQVLTEATKR